MSSARAESTRVQGITIRFEDDARGLLVTEELARVFARAAEVNRERKHSFEISFDSLFAAFGLPGDSAKDATSVWAYELAKTSKTDLLAGVRSTLPKANSLFGHEPDIGLLGTSVRRTTSARRAIEEALEIRKRAAGGGEGGPLDARHVLAALLWLPDYRVGDFEKMGLVLEAWRDAFAGRAEKVYGPESEFWRLLRTPAGDRGSAVSKKAQPGDGEGPRRVPIADLLRVNLHSAARELVNASVAHAQASGSTLLSTRSLLVAFMDKGQRLRDVYGASADWLATQVPPEPWKKLRETLPPPQPASTPLDRVTHATGEVADVFALAATFAKAALEDPGVVHRRHLLGALLAHSPVEPTNAHKMLADSGCDAGKLARDFFDILGTWALDDMSIWLPALPASLAAPRVSATHPVRVRWDLPLLSNDRVNGVVSADRDLLDASKPALRFAKLLVARQVKPPIALGLFGHWGSGKTFFMGLMQGHIEALTGSGPDYVGRVAQVPFNAWHYQDTNLWASLALRVFDALADELSPSPSDAERTRRDLNRKLASSERRAAEAKALRESAIRRSADARTALDRMTTEREDRVRKSVQLQLQAAWTQTSKTDLAKLEELARAFGFSAQIKTAKDLVALKSNLDDLVVRGGALATAAAALRGWPALLVPALAVATLAFGWLVDAVPDWLREHGHPGFILPAGSVVLAQITGLVSAGAAWIGAQTRRASKALEDATTLEADLQLKTRELSVKADPEGQTEEGILRAAIGELDKQIRRTTEELREAERGIAETTTEIDRVNQGGLVYDFVSERLSSTQYTGQIGLLSTIRQDFERLESLLRDFAREGSKPIDRIILYVDDLDRCQPDKVVDVLQAVHLLLAFDIFHVVVGVDPRWLRRSLGTIYAKARGVRDEFSPLDYLEKIFQIPYFLPPLRDRTFESLIDGMIQTRSEWAKSQEGKGTLDPDPHGAGRPPPAPHERPPAPVVSGGGHRPGPKEAPEATKVDVPPRPGSSHQPPIAPASTVAHVVFFEDHEQRFIQGLHRFIDRPRLAGRFVNIYRLLRARAADDGEETDFAKDETSTDYRAALLMLAVNVGYPKVARAFFEALEAELRAPSWRSFLQGQRMAAAGESAGAEERARLLDALEPLLAHVPDEMSVYRRWAARVACFSFESPYPPRSKLLPAQDVRGTGNAAAS